MEEAVMEHVLRYVDVYQEEIIDLLNDEFGIKPHQTTVSRLLKRLDITHKKIKAVAAEQNQELLEQWYDDSRFWRADQIVAVDESAFNEHTGHRKYGWAPQGLPAEMKILLKRNPKWSLLPAYTIDGHLDPLVYQGNITAEIFEEWMEYRVLPQCNPWPGKNSIIIMDNCGIHRSQRVLNMCRERGVWIRWLPPYCPILNPIKESFHDIKSDMRRNYRKVHGEYPNFRDYLINTVRRLGRGPEAARKARGHFYNSGYRNFPEELA
jgi:transposase